MEQVAGQIVETLISEQPGPPGEAVVWAGEAVVDAGPTCIEISSNERVAGSLVKTMQDDNVSGALRRRAGLALGRLGWLPDDLDTFVKVPAASFFYGNRKVLKEIKYDYWIAKYPVTNKQYFAFINDNGYGYPHLDQFWSDPGRSWALKKKRERPGLWEKTDWNNPIFPVVGVSRYEAEAYCRWLDLRLREKGFLVETSDVLVEINMPQNFSARLPKELEWERAARGTDGRNYPWGHGFDRSKANVAKVMGEGLGTTAVCTYPTGASPVGSWDMSGNVLEWVASWEDSSAIVRGGSWALPQASASCCSRSRYAPDDSGLYWGFRVVISLQEDSQVNA